MSNMPVAGKTGTSQESKDLWLSAYTPYLTASVWTGFDDSQPMEHLDQSFHNRLWKKVMTRIHEGYETKQFEMPDTIKKATICAKTGKLASSEFCSAYTEYFAEGTIPKQGCNGHAEEEAAKKAEEEAKKKEEGNTTTPSNNGSSTNSSNNGNSGASGSSGSSGTSGASGSSRSTDSSNWGPFFN